MTVPRLTLVAALGLAAGCTTVGPDHRAPVMDVADAWVSPAAGGEVDLRWWEQLGDPVLTELVTAAAAENLDCARRKLGCRRRAPTGIPTLAAGCRK
jgi:hypothetical protein